VHAQSDLDNNCTGDVIHPTAIVDPQAKLGAGVRIGAYSIIGGAVELGDDTEVASHVLITGRTRLGHGNRIYPYTSLGDAPQDKKYAGEETALEIGDGNTIREYCTVNRGTAQDTTVTRLGNDNWIMAYVHIAHDCQVGNATVFANHATLAGHVHVGDHTILGGFTGVHQFVRIGAHAFTGISSVITQDVPTYVMVAGNPTKPYGINSEGLRRRGFSAETIARLKAAYKTLYRSGLSLEDAKAEIARQRAECPELQPLMDFLAASTRGVLRG
jgi:UDP-N-acetylglucosamine acyltransferase